MPHDPLKGGAQRLSAAQRGYDARWRRRSKAFLRAHPLCEYCLKRGLTKLARAVDHKVPHRLGQAIESGDAQAIAAAELLFWDEANWQGLCFACHDAVKRAEEHGRLLLGAGADGQPIDPKHPWNTG